MRHLRTTAGWSFAVTAAAPLAVVLACSKSGSDTSATSVSSAASASAAAVPSASTTPGVALSLTPSAYMSIPERFMAEAARRPTGIVRVEDATDAFRKAGFTLTDEKQHLASAYKAKYCVGAKAKGEEISFSVCEYDSEGKATEGAALNDKAFANIKNRHTHRNGATTLTILESTKNEANDALVQKLVDTFQGLKPASAPAASGAPPAAASAAASK